MGERVDFGFGAKERDNALTLIALALAEDLNTTGDLTANLTIPESSRGSARFVSRTQGRLSGLPVLALLATRFEIEAGWKPTLDDGARLEPGLEIARVEGSMRALLAFERTALNFIQRLSGIASLTARFVAEVAGTRAVILDTRKTTPGWRALEKYAVRCGGGKNHRFGLYDAVLIKDNHLAWLAADTHDPVLDSNRLSPDGATISRALTSARRGAPAGTVIEIEVDSLDQFDRALEGEPDIILIDNLGPADLAEALRRRDTKAPRVLLEASGGINLNTVRALAETGVDRISVGALTHSAPALDIGLDFDEALPS